MKRSYYEIMGVAQDADQAAIDATYAQAMVRLKEDVRRGVSDAATEAQLIRDGYRILSDPEKRADYDRHLTAVKSSAAARVVPEMAGVSRKLGLHTLMLITLVAVVCGVAYTQVTRRMDAVKVEYAAAVARKQAAQNLPIVVNAPPQSAQDMPSVRETVRTVPTMSDAGAAAKDARR